MKSTFDTHVSLSPKIMDKIKPLLSEVETIIIANEITKMHNHGGSDSRIFVMTNGALFLFRQKTFGGIEISHEFTIIDIRKIYYIEPQSLTFSFSDKSLEIKTDKAFIIAKNILHLASLIYYGRECPIDFDSTPSSMLNQIKYTQRPINSLITRLFTYSHVFKSKVLPFAIQYLSDIDSHPPTTHKLILALSQGDPSPTFAYALGFDFDVKALLLDNFNPKYLDVFLPQFIGISMTVTKIAFENYREVPANPFVVPSADASKLSELSFRNCCFSLINSVMDSLQSFNGRILTLAFEKCKLAAQDIRSIFAIIRKYPAFMKLKILRFDDGAASQMDLEDFSLLLPKTRWLKMLSISSVSIDASVILKCVFKYSITLKSIAVTNCRFLEPIEEGITIPQCITLIDISQCEVTPTSIASLSKILFIMPRNSAMTLYSSELASSFPSSDVLRAFLVPEPRPVLTELRWNRNELSPEDSSLFFKFLRTQTTLKHLTLSGCFNERISESLPHFAKFIQDGYLQGFDLTGSFRPGGKEELIKMLRSIIGIPTLQVINVDKTEIGDEGLSVILKIINANRHMISISCDGAKPSSEDSLLSFYNTVYASKNITCVGVPKLDLASFGLTPSAIKLLKSKKPPINASARLVFYDRIASELKGSSQPRDISSLLLETGFSRESMANPLDELMNVMGKMVQCIKSSSMDETLGDSSSVASTFIGTLRNSSIIKPRESKVKIDSSSAKRSRLYSVSKLISSESDYDTLQTLNTRRDRSSTVFPSRNDK